MRRLIELEKIGESDTDPWPDEDGKRMLYPCPECEGLDVWGHKEGFWCKNCGAMFRLRGEEDK